MKQLICNFNMFDLEQSVYIYAEEDGVKSYEPVARCTKIGNLGQMLVELCYANDIHHIHLTGNKNYLESILKDIDKHGNAAYSNGEIIVEVN